MSRGTNNKLIIANNLKYILDVSGASRKEFCNQNGLKYTTLCDWLNARTYPRLDVLEKIASNLSIELKDMFTDIEADDGLKTRVFEYARRLSGEDYSYMYPEGFFDLFGVLEDVDFSVPEDLTAEEPDEVFA